MPDRIDPATGLIFCLRYRKGKCVSKQNPQPSDNFMWKHKHGVQVQSTMCIFCQKAKNENISRGRTAWKTNPHREKIVDERGLNRHYKRRYGITLDQYNEMFIRQNGCCAICAKPQSMFRSRLAVDHDHVTKKVRGLLCAFCNYGLGKFFEEPNFLMSAANYLMRNK